MEPQDASPLEDKAPAPASSGGARRQRKYNRKTKRFVWPEELHHLFVATIFDMGLRQATPKALLALMQETAPNAALTTEHIKSHLQKFRINQQRTRTEFLAGYNRSKCGHKPRRDHRTHRSGAASTCNLCPLGSPERRASDSSTGADNQEPTGDQARRSPSQEFAADLLLSAADAADSRWRRPVAETHFSPLPYAPGGAQAFVTEPWTAKTYSHACTVADPGRRGSSMPETATAARSEAASSPDVFMEQEQLAYLEMQMRIAMQAQRSLYQQTRMREVPTVVVPMSTLQEPNSNRPMQWQRQGSGEPPAPASFAPDSPLLVETPEDADPRLPPEGAVGFRSAAATANSQEQPAEMSEMEDIAEKSVVPQSDDGSVDIARLSINLDDEDLFGFMES